MHFTVEIARFAGHSSRQVLQLASGIIARAVKTFAARGIDPQRYANFLLMVSDDIRCPFFSFVVSYSTSVVDI